MKEEFPHFFKEFYRHTGVSSYQFELKKYVLDEDSFLMEDGPLAPAVEPQRFFQAHIDQRCGEAKRHLDALRSHISGVERELSTLESELDSHLWIQPGFSATALRNLKDTRDEAKQLEKRMQAILDGFSKLPVLIEEPVE